MRKSQHKYIIGPRYSGIHEILKESGVSVEVPSLDDNSETITLRGEQDKLGPALTMVYSKVRTYLYLGIYNVFFAIKWLIFDNTDSRKGA